MSSARFRSIDPGALRGEGAAWYFLRIGSRQIPLEGGEMIIGRGEGCAVVVSENLVSRRHARIALEGGRPVIEDLGSANGTFVNQARLRGKTQLFPGDHVFVGTCEMELVRRDPWDSEPISKAGPDEDRLTPANHGSLAPRSVSAPSSENRLRGAESIRAAEGPTEVRGLDYLGHLADKMFTMGRVDAAVRILTAPLQDMLQGLRGGRSQTAVMVDLSGRYAVKLAHETLDGAWLDLAIEIHLLAARPLREDTIQQVAALRTKAPIGDEALLARYHARLRLEMASFPTSERLLCERIGCLLPGIE